MVRDKIFISYSHKDDKLFQEFQVHLKPWHDRLAVWTDERLKISQDWHQEIQQAIDSSVLGILLISPDFMASDYIRDQELPALLKAREEGHIELTCLYLRPSGVDDDVFTVTLENGATAQVKLTKYQSLNPLEEPLAGRKQHTQDAVFGDAVAKIKELLASRDQRGNAKAPLLGRRHELTIRVKIVGDQLTRAFYHHGKIAEGHSSWQPLHSRLLPWREWGPDIPDQKDFRAALYETLFGDKPGEVLERLFATPGSKPNPIRLPVRVRVQTADPLLTELPWPQTNWEGEPLWKYGWTFELIGSGGSPESFSDVTLKGPCPVLVIAPASSREVDSEFHLRALEECLDQVWPGYRDRPRLVGNQEELEVALRERRPRIVYYYGPASGSGRDLWLLLEGPESEGIAALDITTLAELWSERPPQVLFLNLVEEEPIRIGATLSQLHDKVPLVVAQTWPIDDLATSRRAALAWFRELLAGGDDTDPVWALHKVLHEYDLSTALVWGRYGRWHYQVQVTSPREQLARLMLDRKNQRGSVHRALSELVKGGNRRLTCLLAYGDESNMLELFADQLNEYLRTHGRELAQVRRLRLQLPPELDDFDPRQVSEQVRRDLGLKPRQPLKDALTQRKPRAPHRTRALLLLDWGVRSRISSNGLRSWMKFCCDQLAVQCPSDMRLLSVLALQYPEEKHQAINRLVSNLRVDPQFLKPAFKLEPLEPLGKVDIGDLTDFLQEKHTSCPRELMDKMPRLILNKTAGRFAETVELIEQAEYTTWRELYYELHTPEVEESDGAEPEKDPLL